jgi:hypothetical protein
VAVLTLCVGLSLGPAFVGAGAGLSVRDFVALSEPAQTQYVTAYMFGAAYAMNKAGKGDADYDGCTEQDVTADRLAARVRWWAVTAPPQDAARSVNRLLGEFLFDGCRFATGTDDGTESTPGRDLR